MTENSSEDNITKILVVDDDFSFSFLVTEALLKQGFDVEEIDNGIECLERIEDVSPDLIVLDVMMPIQDGYETCKAIRALPKFKLTPILMMTGLEDEASIAAAFEVGATDFIAKPFNYSLFLQRINYILRNSQQTKELIKSQDKIRRLAYYDSLTDLPNRAYFKELLSQTIKLAAREKRIAALLFIDLDNFKRVNDTLGHTIGDKLLKSVTERMRNCLRETDIICCDFEDLDSDDDDKPSKLARLGGDEFTILLPEIATPDGAAVVAQRIIKALSVPFNLDGNDVVTSPSIGISLYPQDAQTPEECLVNSDIAMYHAKRQGKNGYRFFNSEMNVESLKRMNIENSLRTALTNNEFKLVYQPQIELKTNEMSGVEALIRWHSPVLGFVSPDEFIPLAEENGMIVQIGEWVLREACRQAKEWLDNGVKLKRIAVNVSSRQFAQTNFDQIVINVLEETGLPAEVLDLEMTEGMLMNHAEDSLKMLNRLKSIGVGLSIDDFGTGYSSLAYLSQFPIDHLKIDKSFIDHVSTNRNDSAIVKAIIAMASSMEMRVTSEGVEENDQLAYLKSQSCTEVQGYYFSKPLAADEIYNFNTEKEA